MKGRNSKFGAHGGLVGNHGFVGPGLHVNASYDCNGMVFVVAEGNWDRAGWRRVKRGKARKADIIRCSYCGRSAVLLDHSWPYCAEATVCARHKNWQKHYEARFKEKP